MPRGKKKLLDPPVEWKLSLPQSVTAPVSLLLSNPLTGLPKHGARSRLVTRLLQDWLDEQAKGAIQLDTVDTTDSSGLDKLER